MKDQRFVLQSVSSGPTINSQGRLTDEFRLCFEGGASGRGSSPMGETRSRYEANAEPVSAPQVLDRLAADGVIGREFSQHEFDGYLAGSAARLGSSAVFALSCAFFDAALGASGALAPSAGSGPGPAPRFCLNILNGGQHAYTNPVLSDFHEFLLVPTHADLEQLLEDHQAIQARVKAHLSQCGTTMVNGNVVHVLGRGGNRECIEFLLGLLEELGLSGRYGLMIDAAAAQLWNGSAYALELAEKQTFTPQAFEDYWGSVLDKYPLAWLEDPFAEHDLEHWRRLTAKAGDCCVLGDDVHSGDPARLRDLLVRACISGVILKPDQAGSISATLEAVAIAREAAAPLILSHRSISTDALVLPHLMVHCGIELAKFGPLLSDFSAVLKINEVLRRAPAKRGVETEIGASRERHGND
jgi:enolase